MSTYINTMNMEDVYVRDDDDEFSLPKAMLAEPKEKKGFFNKIKRKVSNGERPKPEKAPKNLKISVALSEPEEKDEKIRNNGSNSARESIKNEEKTKPAKNSLHIRKDSGGKEEMIPDIPIVKEPSKKDLRCPIPPSPNSVIRKGTITKPEKSKNEEGLEHKDVKGASNSTKSLKVEGNIAPIDRTLKRQKTGGDENQKLNYSVEEERKEEKVVQSPIVKNEIPPKEDVIDDKLKFETDSVSSESISRKSFYQDDSFLEEFLADKHMQASKSEAKPIAKPHGKKLTNSLIQLRREEATNYKGDYNSGKACNKCIVI